jgi:hypothetical protein
MWRRRGIAGEREVEPGRSDDKSKRHEGGDSAGRGRLDWPDLMGAELLKTR